MHVLKASAIYFISVFGVGFVLGTIRVLLIVPYIGVRWAELFEQPLMLLASFYFARLVVRYFGPFAPARRLAIGIIALAFLLAAELSLTLFVQGLAFSQYLASRDAVAGVAYLLSLAAFALMPLFAGKWQGPKNSFKPKPLHGSQFRH
jgi:hypothetical protein